MTDERASEPVEPAPIVDPAPVVDPASMVAAPPPPPPVAAQASTAWAPAPMPVVATAPRRTTLAAAAGVVLMVLGVLGGLFALLILTIGRSIIDNLDLANMPGMSGVEDPGSVISSAVTFVGVLLVVLSLVYLLAGIGALRSAGWGRILGIIIGVIGALFWLPALTGNSGAGGGSPVFALIFLAAHVYVFVALAFFWRARTA